MSVVLLGGRSDVAVRGVTTARPCSSLLLLCCQNGGEAGAAYWDHRRNASRGSTCWRISKVRFFAEVMETRMTGKSKGKYTLP
jgi:hypothetical protein